MATQPAEQTAMATMAGTMATIAGTMATIAGSAGATAGTVAAETREQTTMATMARTGGTGAASCHYRARASAGATTVMPMANGLAAGHRNHQHNAVHLEKSSNFVL